MPLSSASRCNKAATAARNHDFTVPVHASVLVYFGHSAYTANGPLLMQWNVLPPTASSDLLP